MTCLMYQISGVPDLKNRLDAMVFRRRFDMLLGEIMPDLGIVRSAALELKGSERLREVLAVVLTLGNALNGGTFRGNAAGFQLEALTKVSRRVVRRLTGSLRRHGLRKDQAARLFFTILQES